MGLSPVEELQKAVGGVVTKPRIWMVRGMALVCPQLENGLLTAGMVVIDDNAPTGLINFIDIDSGQVHQILIPSKFEEACLFDVLWEQKPSELSYPNYL